MLLVFLALAGLIVYGIVDAANRPPQQWLDAHQNKLLWLMVQIFIPLIGTVGYLGWIRPKLQAVPPTDDEL